MVSFGIGPQDERGSGVEVEVEVEGRGVRDETRRVVFIFSCSHICLLTFSFLIFHSFLTFHFVLVMGELSFW